MCRLHPVWRHLVARLHIVSHSSIFEHVNSYSAVQRQAVVWDWVDLKKPSSMCARKETRECFTLEVVTLEQEQEVMEVPL